MVDLHFIAHSRGSVVVTTAMQQLAADLPLLPAIQGGYWRETLLDPHPSHTFDEAPLGHTDNPLSLAAYAGGLAFQFAAADPLPLKIPGRVTELQDFFEHTPMNLLGSTSPILFTTENLVNPYGVSLGNGIDLLNPSTTIYNVLDLTAPGLGHTETYQWYAANIVPTLGTSGPFIHPPIHAPLSGRRLQPIGDRGQRSLECLRCRVHRSRPHQHDDGLFRHDQLGRSHQLAGHGRVEYLRRVLH